MRIILRFSLPPHLTEEKEAPFRHFSFNPIASPCNDIMEQLSKFQKNQMVNKKINFEIASPSQGKKRFLSDILVSIRLNQLVIVSGNNIPSQVM